MYSEPFFTNLTNFHCGIFASFYLCASYAIWVYYNHIRGDIALSLESAASGLAHIFMFIIGITSPNNPHLNLALACYCCAASPTILLCIREAIEPGWLSWKKYFHYIGPFFIGTVAAAIFAHPYIFYFMITADLWFCCYASYRLIIGINNHEKLIKEYFAEIDTYSHNWVKYFVYFQILNVIAYFLLYVYLSPTLNIIFNYFQAGYWLYFLLMCKKYRYYSRQIPKELEDDLKQQSVAGYIISKNEEDKEDSSVEKSMISPETMEYIEKRLSDLEYERYFLDKTLNLASLAQNVGTNRTYMSVYFRNKETTFWDYINRKRCEFAIEMMKEHPSITMSVLAQQSGYKTENCFRTSFSTIYGKTPFMYKRDMKLEK